MGRAAWLAWATVMNLPERPMRWAQSRLRGGRMGWLFVAPNLAVFGLFTFLPIAINVHYAVTGGTALLPSERPYTGAENLRELLACGNHLDPTTCETDLFWFSIWNTLRFVVWQVGLMVAFSLVTALVMNRRIRGRGFFRAAFFYPVLLSPVVVALIWKWILARDGILNAGLQAIPADIYEAADMDAAPPWRVFTRITLPLLMPSLLVVVVLGVIRAVQVFDEVYVLTGGGPGSATTYLVQFIYSTGFAQQVRQYGLASAASLLLAGVLMLLTLAQLAVTRRSNG